MINYLPTATWLPWEIEEGKDKRIRHAKALVLFTAKSLRVIDVIPAAFLPTKVILPAGSGTTPSYSPRPIEVAYPRLTRCLK
jgi:hypothetical protein